MNYRIFIFLPALMLACLLPASATLARVQNKSASLPQPNGYVNDFAGVVDAATKRRMETILAELYRRAEIEFAIATVKSTEGQDTFDYSLRMAREWNVGSREAKKKSLLLIVVVDEHKSFAQVSKRFERDLPDGLIGEMNNRVRGALHAGRYSEGLMTAVQTLVATLSEKFGLNIEGVDQRYAYGQLHSANRVSGSFSVSTPTKASADPAPTASASPSPSPAAAPSAPVPAESAITQPATTAPAQVITEPAAPATTGAVPTATETASASPASRESVNATTASVPVTSTLGRATFTARGGAGEKAELDATLALAPAERIEKLKAFINARPRSAYRTRAAELIVSARAAFGDEKLQAGDVAGGAEQFRLAIAESPANISDKLFAGIIAQLPLNLFLRNQREAAFEVARLVEARVKDDPKRLLAVAGFYLNIEEPYEAARIAELAIKLAPEMAAAHQALGAARHIGLRLDDAAAEYARSLELDPKLTGARRSLADLRRANGKAEEALALYREQLKADPADKSTRAGIVLSLFDLGKREEAEAQLDAALKDDARNLALLVGAAYWYAARNENTRALELSQQAVALEPRYTWAHIALARALVAQKRPGDAERALRFARQYGRFPTLDYELANALASAGLYEEAAEELARSFTLKDGQLETQLAGRTRARAASFIELLAPERRASIFQPIAADTESNARMLKGLLAFSAAMNPAGGREMFREASAISAAREWTSGQDAMRVYRQLYAASRLLERGVALPTVLALTESATSGVEAGLDVPAATIAVLADNLRDIRARAIAAGATPSVPDVQPDILSKILRGRIEDLTGYALFNQGKTSESVIHLRRAVSVLPESTVWLRTAHWHLGTALNASGDQQEALAAYIKSYNNGAPDPVRRAVIEGLYRKVYGSLDGLDAKIGPAPSISSTVNNNTTAQPQQNAPAATSDVMNQKSGDKSTTTTTEVQTPAPTSSPAQSLSPPPIVMPAPASTTDSKTEPTSSPTPAPAPATSPASFAINGRVVDARGNGVFDVVVVLIGPQGTLVGTKTDVSGNYSFDAIVRQGSYRIIPSKDGYTFSPIDRTVPELSGNQTNIDFVAATKQ